MSQMANDRLIGKEGICHLTQHWNIPRTSGSFLHKYIVDSGSSVLQTQWRWLWIVMFLIFPTLWVFFAVIYYAFASWNGDLVDDPSKSNVTACVENLRSFTAAVLFSLETQERIGYGFRYSNEACNAVLATLTIQTSLGKIVLATICGSVFARFLRPTERAKTLIFSKTAVITQHGNTSSRCFMFRLGDVDDRQLNAINYRLYFVDKKKDPETMIPMRFEENGDLFMLPTVVRHEINHYSPLFSLKKDDMVTADFEVVVIVEGVVEATGYTVQTRTSYLSSEVQWGHEFHPLQLSNLNEDPDWIRVQYKDFDRTSKVLMSNQSVSNLARMVPYEHREHYHD